MSSLNKINMPTMLDRPNSDETRNQNFLFESKRFQTLSNDLSTIDEQSHQSAALMEGQNEQLQTIYGKPVKKMFFV